jgi:hypothetical protein
VSEATIKNHATFIWSDGASSAEEWVQCLETHVELLQERKLALVAAAVIERLDVARGNAEEAS